MQREFSFRTLTTGCNGQGISSVLTAEEISLRSLNNIEFRAISVSARCIINAGDSVQKSCNENKIKLNKVKCIILSSMAPHHVSGLAGLIQSMSDLGLGTITIIGPAGLLGLLANMKSFVNRKYNSCRFPLFLFRLFLLSYALLLYLIFLALLIFYS